MQYAVQYLLLVNILTTNIILKQFVLPNQISKQVLDFQIFLIMSSKNDTILEQCVPFSICVEKWCNILSTPTSDHADIIGTIPNG